MECPRCGSVLADGAVAPPRCQCGWDPGEARKAGLRIFLAGLILDVTGTLLLAYSILKDRAYLPAGIGLMMVGGSVLALGAIRMARGAAQNQKGRGS